MIMEKLARNNYSGNCRSADAVIQFATAGSRL